MFGNLRRRTGDEAGFTLIELLVAILIVGILAAVAIPSVLGNRVRAGDTAAKGLVHTAETTAINYGLGIGYTGMTPSVLHNLEKTINITANGQAVLVNAAPTSTGYLLTVVSSTANTFNLTYSSTGAVQRTCSIARGNGNTSTNTGGGCNNGGW